METCRGEVAGLGLEQRQVPLRGNTESGERERTQKKRGRERRMIMLQLS